MMAQAAPFDVQLDDHTIVEPDVMVFCKDPSQAFAIRAATPPDLVVEVLSRSTSFKDRHLKLYKYCAARVKEVWIVSPKKETIEVYLFGEGREEPEVYTFGDEVPVRISNGLLKWVLHRSGDACRRNWSDWITGIFMTAALTNSESNVRPNVIWSINDLYVVCAIHLCYHILIKYKQLSSGVPEGQLF